MGRCHTDVTLVHVRHSELALALMNICEPILGQLNHIDSMRPIAPRSHDMRGGTRGRPARRRDGRSN